MVESISPEVLSIILKLTFIMFAALVLYFVFTFIHMQINVNKERKLTQKIITISIKQLVLPDTEVTTGYIINADIGYRYEDVSKRRALIKAITVDNYAEVQEIIKVFQMLDISLKIQYDNR